MSDPPKPTTTQAWARLRFAIIGPLLISPPSHGELATAIKHLAEKVWRHPTNGETIQFSASTIEAWYYKARRHPDDPVGALKRDVRSDAGRHSINPKLIDALKTQYANYPEWSYLLHVRNLEEAVNCDKALGPMCAYATIRRYMTRHGMRKKKKRKGGRKECVESSWEVREKRSYETTHVGALWHLDFHHGSRRVIGTNGKWYTPLALGIHDDHSRVACHVQWYLRETAEDLIHGLCQAFQKYGLPRAIMTDNGAAMKAEEFLAGLERLGITHEKTLPYAPYQNAKEEVFWGSLEGRLIAMLSRIKELDLPFLNEATQAWVDLDYNRVTHREIGQTPLDRYRKASDVLRDCPSSEKLREVFRLDITRTQRQSDGTITIEGVRFEIPARFRHIKQLTVRYARWNLQLVHLVDPRSGNLLCQIFPLDKEANADGRRRRIEPSAPPNENPPPDASQDNVPPLLRRLMERHKGMGLPPGYIAKPMTDAEELQGDSDNATEVPS